MPPTQIPMMQNIPRGGSSEGPIPTVSPDQTVQADPTTHLDQQHLDVDSAMSSQLASVDNVAKQAIKLQNDIADQTADTTGTNAQNEYLIWRKSRLYGDPESGWQGYANMKGDPQKIYQQFDQEERDKLDELAKAPQGNDWSQETQNVVNRRLSKAYKISRIETLTEYSRQNKKWSDDSGEAGVQLAQNGMFNASNFISFDKDGKVDPTSFGLVDAKIHDIQQLNIAKGFRDMDAVKMGPSTDDNDGQDKYLDDNGVKQNVKLGPQTQLSINQDISNGLKDTITNLAQSKTPDGLNKAQAMLDHYNGMLFPGDRNKINEIMEKENLDEKSFTLARKWMTLPPDQVEKNLSTLVPKVAFMTEEKIAQEKARLEQMKKDQQDDNFRALNQAAVKYRQDNPNATIDDFQSQGFYAKTVGNISPQQKKAIDTNFDPPKKTSPQTLVSAMRALRGDDPDFDPTTATPDRVVMKASGLGTDAAGNMVRRQLMNLADPSKAQQNQQYQFAMHALKTSLNDNGLITYNNNAGTNIQPGSQEEVELTKYQHQFAQQMKVFGNLNNEQMQDKVDQFVQSQAKTRPSGGFFSRLFGGTSQIPQKLDVDGTGQKPPAVPGQLQMTFPQQRAKAIRDFTSTNGRPPNQKELDQAMGVK